MSTWISQGELEGYCRKLNVSATEKRVRYAIMKTLNYGIFGVVYAPYLALMAFYIYGYAVLFRLLATYLTINFTTWFIVNFRLIDSLRPRPLGTPKVGKKVCVIGAGATGLAALKELIEEGHEPEAFESRPTFGGLFAFNPDVKLGCYDSCTLTSSPFITAYSDFPPEEGDIIHWHNTEYIAYLKRYIDHHNLMPRISFNTEVKCVQKNEETGMWTVNYMGQDGMEKSKDYEHVAVCAGLHYHGRVPNYPGVEDYKGEIFHSAQYNFPSEVKGKRVVILGIGESAADVAAEIAYAADEAWLSARRGSFVVPRINPNNGLPNDFDSTRLRHSTAILLRDFVFYWTRWLCWFSRCMTKDTAIRFYFLDKSGAGAIRQTATKSNNFCEAIACGKLKVKPGIARFEGENTIVFLDGTRVEADALCLCTGYTPQFNYLKLPKTVRSICPSQLYRYMIHPELGIEVAFLGFTRPTIGTIPTIGEIQSRWFAKMVTGTVKLPCKATMWQAIEKWNYDRQYVFPRTEQIKSITEFIPFMDAIAGDVGCRPNPYYLLSKPYLLYKVLAGATMSYHWRLTGPGASKKAHDAIMMIPRTHGLDELALLYGIRLLVWPLEFLGVRELQSVSTPV